MRTTITIDDRLISELMSLYKSKNKTSAVVHAVSEQIRLAKLKLLAGKLGSIDVDDEAIANINQADYKREQLLKKGGLGGYSK